MARQHASPVLLSQGRGSVLSPIGHLAGDDAVSEADIQALVHAFPGSLPIAEIDPIFAEAVAVCRELSTPAGPIDNLLITPSGLLILVECKLWRNPEGRREVVGQILDYAKELSRWTSSDLQREVSRRLGRDGNVLLDLVRQADPTVDEITFNDALTLNLRRGRFLLLIVGDGIREGVEAIAEYLQRHAGLHFSLGLVEMPIYVLPDGDRLVVPRVLARTTIITRNVIAVPDGYALVEEDEPASEAEPSDETKALRDERLRFWTEFCDGLTIDDPDQPRPKPARMGYMNVWLAGSEGGTWLTIYREAAANRLGLYAAATKDGPGAYALETLFDDWSIISPELGGGAEVVRTGSRERIAEERTFSSLADPFVRAEAFGWLAERVNAFVNVLRPRVRSAVQDYRERTSTVSGM